MTLTFNRALEGVEVHVYAEFYQSMCSSSWVIVLTEHEAENNTAVATVGSYE